MINHIPELCLFLGITLFAMGVAIYLTWKKVERLLDKEN